MKKAAVKCHSEDLMFVPKTHRYVANAPRNGRYKGKGTSGIVSYQTSSVSLPENPPSRHQLLPVELDDFSDGSDDDDRELIEIHESSVSPASVCRDGGAKGDSDRKRICIKSREMFQPIKPTPKDGKMEYPKVPRLLLDGATGDSSVSKTESSPDILNCQPWKEACLHECLYCTQFRSFTVPPIMQVYPLWMNMMNEDEGKQKNAERKKEKDSERESERESNKEDEEEQEDVIQHSTQKKKHPDNKREDDDHDEHEKAHTRRAQHSSSDPSHQESSGSTTEQIRGRSSENAYQFGSKSKGKTSKREKIKVIVEDKSFKIHKDTLALHSRAIRREFHKVGSTPSFITLRGMTKEDFVVVRNWMMNGDQRGINERNVMDIKKIAEKLEIRELRRFCDVVSRAEAGVDPKENPTEDQDPSQIMKPDETDEKMISKSKSENKQKDVATVSPGPERQAGRINIRSNSSNSVSTRSSSVSPRNKSSKKPGFLERLKFTKKKKPEDKPSPPPSPSPISPAPDVEIENPPPEKPTEPPPEKLEPESTTEYEYSYETGDEIEAGHTIFKRTETEKLSEEELEHRSEHGYEEVKEPKRKPVKEEGPQKRIRLCRHRMYHGREPIGSTVIWNVHPNCSVHRAMLADKREDFDRKQEKEEALERASKHEPRETFLPVIKPRPKPKRCSTSKNFYPDVEEEHCKERPCTSEEMPSSEEVIRHRKSRPHKKDKHSRTKVKKIRPKANEIGDADLVSLITGNCEVKVNRFRAAKYSKVIYEMVRNKNVSAKAVSIRGIEEPILKELSGWLNGETMCIYPNEIKKFMCLASTLDMPELSHKLRHYQICVDSGCHEPLTVAPEQDSENGADGCKMVDAISDAMGALWDAGKCNVYIKERVSMENVPVCSEPTQESFECSNCKPECWELKPRHGHRKKSSSYEALVSEKKTEERRVTDKERRKKKEERCHKDPDKEEVEERICDIYKCECKLALPCEPDFPVIMSDYLCGREKCLRAKKRLVMIMDTLQPAGCLVLGENFCGGNGPLADEEENPYVPCEDIKFPFNSTKYHWVVEAPKPMCVAFCASVLVGDNLIVSGGRMVRDTRTSSPEAVTCISSFNLCRQRWTHSGFMRYARIHHTAVEHDGDVYFIGGLDENLRMLASVENLNICSGRCNEVSPLNLARAGLAAASFRGVLWVAGGLSEFPIGYKSSHVLDFVECYDPCGNSWQSVQCLSIPRAFATMIPCETMLYVVGGVTPVSKVDNSKEAVESVASVEFITDVGTSWTSCGCIRQPRYCANAIILGSSVYMFGGMCLKRGIRISLIEKLPKSTEMWDKADDDFADCLQAALK